jgi:hypothetical protein
MTSSIEIGWYGPTQDCWGWMLEHFRDVVVLRQQDIGKWIEDHSGSRSVANDDATALLLFASDHRTDATMDVIRSLDLKYATAETTSQSMLPWGLALGTDWSGHRRTQPLPDAWNTFYWYELHDRLLPWLGQLDLSKEYPSKQSSDVAASSQGRKPSVRVQRWIDSMMISKNLRTSQATKPRLALVVVDQMEIKQLWVDALGRHQIQTVCAAPDQTDFWLEPDWIVIDLAKPPLDSTLVNDEHGLEGSSGSDPLAKALVRLTDQFPQSIKVVVDGFPRWDRWNDLQSKGADLLVAKPYHIEGLIDTLQLVG